MIATLPLRAHRTAEWQCSKCDVTNRKLVPADEPATMDRCVACHARHIIWPGDRPVRWNAEAR